ncbi:MAG TPA: PKD domain-containing protein, partial [Bacteroidia bacterium]|nr:PKD domain-containing protein [Bacteroidia bacterium]
HKIQVKSLATTSVGTISKYIWDFGAGGTSGVNPTPFFTYQNPGKYTVSLIVENNFGCKSNAATKNNYIKVYPPVNPSFTIKDNFSCDTFLLSSFINTTTGGTGLTYKWYFGDGDSLQVSTTDTVKHLYKNSGAYTVKLVATNASNCKGTYSTPLDKRVFIGKPKPSASFVDTTCSATATTFTGSSVPPASYYKWIFSDRNITINGNPINYTFNTAGTFDVSLIALNAAGCSDTIKKKIVVKDAPLADFTMDQRIGCSLPFPVKFTYPGAGNLIYSWDFGDGSPKDSTQSPSHTYVGQGYYSVRLTVKDPSTGCSNSVFKASVIGISLPLVDFTYVPASGCKPLKVTATAKVTNLLSPLTVSRYIWEFGDGTTLDSTLASVSHVYTGVGTFLIRLITVSSIGCRDTSISKPVVVSNICDDDGSGGDAGGAGGFSIGKSCVDKYLVTFRDTVKNSKTIKWIFGDGTGDSTGTLNTIVHQYQPPQKIYTVTITRKDTITNAISTAQKNIVIIDEKANFVPDITNTCKAKQVNFKTIGIDSSRIKKYKWDYGDSTNIVLDNAANYQQTGMYLNGNTGHVYLKNGVFSVKLLIEDKLGCLDSMIYPLPIRIQGPVAGFIAEPKKGCGRQLEVTFKDTTIRNGSIPIVKRVWDFGDGFIDSTSTDTIIKHTYTSNNTYNWYTVKLKVVDSIGCESEEIRVDHVKKYYPRVNFYSYDTLLCGRLAINLYNSSNALNGTYLWSFGDSTTSNTYNATHDYVKTGFYTIKLVVKDESGCKDSLTKPAYIKLVKPKADFIVGDTSQCAPTSITFRDTSTYASSWQWFFDGADGGTDKNPAPHIYGDPGYYTVKLAISGTSGCKDTMTKRIHILGPIGKLTHTSTQGCAPFSFHMGVNGTNIKTFAWDFGDGTPVVPLLDSAVDHVYELSGKYIPNAILTSPEGCVVTLKMKDTVIVDELHPDFLIKPYAHCDSAFVEFVDKSTVSTFSSIIKSEWFWGDGTSTIGPLTAPHKYPGPGIYTVMLVATSQYGCTDTLTKKDSVQVRKSPQITINGDTLICLSPGSLLNYESTIISKDSISSFNWLIDNVLVSTDTNLHYDFRVGSYHELKLKATSIYGCNSTGTKMIFLDSVKANISINSLQFCGSGTVELKNQTSSVTPIVLATWDMGDGKTFNAVDTSYAYTIPGSYLITLKAATEKGCKDSSQTTQPVEVYPFPQASIIGDTLQCLPGTLTYKSEVITKDSIAQFYWKLNNAITDSLKDFVRHFNTGNHTLELIVNSKAGCKDTVTKNIVVDSLFADFEVLTPILCDKNDSAQFKNLSFASAGTINYKWDFGDSTTSVQPSPSHVYVKPPGVYDVLLVATSISGCVDSAFKKAAIHQYRNPIVTLKKDSTSCIHQSLTFNAILIVDDSIQSMEWKVDSATVSTTADLKLMYHTPGVHVINYHVITTHGCVKDTTFELTIHPIPVPAATADTIICLGSSVQLNATEGVYYKWSPGHGLSNAAIQNPVAVPEKSTQYAVQVINQYGCMGNDTVNIQVDKRVDVAVKDQPPICSGESAVLKIISNATKFKWTPGESLSSDTIANPVASPLVTTEYNVIAYSLNACPNDSAKVVLEVGEIPEIEMVNDTSVVGGSTIQMFAQVNNVPVEYVWDPFTGLSCSNCPDPVIRNIKEDKVYILTVTSPIGCVAKDTLNIRIFCGENLWVPNAFTPNNNGLNDVFYPQAPGYGIVRLMTIYDRWGEVVFKQEDFPLNDSNYGWDGTYKGDKIAGPDVYTYVIHFICVSGESFEFIG